LQLFNTSVSIGNAGAPFDDIWRSDCLRYELQYLGVQRGANREVWLRIAAKERRYLDGTRAKPVAYSDGVAPNEAVVRHSGGEVPTKARCLKA